MMTLEMRKQMNKYISFICKGQFFALSINTIEKIVLYEEPVVVPETSDYILGYTSYDGAPMPIIDLNRRFFDLETNVGELSKVVVVHWQDHRLGLLVDEVSNVQDYEKQEKDESLKDSEESYIVGTIYNNDQIILEVDINKMFVDKAEAELLRLL